jgi:hypothetical protein
VDRAALVAVVMVTVALACLSPRVVTAQQITGRVIDSATARPLPGVRVTLLRDTTAVAVGRTDDSGRVSVRAPIAGIYRLQLRGIGYLPLTVQMNVRGDTVVATPFRLTQVPGQLDTVFTRGVTSLFNVTPGRVKYNEHAKLHLGQMVPGLEIIRSRMLVSEYLGTLPGLRLFPSLPLLPGRKVSSGIQGRDGIVVPARGPQCLYTRLDHVPLSRFFAPPWDYKHIDEFLDPEDVMAVEVYHPGSVPKEWQILLLTTPCSFVQIWTRVSW